MSDKCVWIEVESHTAIREFFYRADSCKEMPDHIGTFWWPYCLKRTKRNCPYCGKEIEVRDD